MSSVQPELTADSTPASVGMPGRSFDALALSLRSLAAKLESDADADAGQGDRNSQPPFAVALRG